MSASSVPSSSALPFADLKEGDVLWSPSPAQADASRLAAFQRWLADARGLAFADYQALWQWSVDHLDDFWQAVWDFFSVVAEGDQVVVAGVQKISDGAAVRVAPAAAAAGS